MCADRVSPTSDALWKQVDVLKMVPGSVLTVWPAYFTFAAVRYVSSTIISSIPSVPGYPGTVLNAAILGFTDCVKFVTWDLITTTKVVTSK